MSVIATIRPACDGLFGPCVAVEEGTTNLITNGGCADGLTGWSFANGGSISLDTSKSLFFGQSCKFTPSGGPYDGTKHTITLTASTTYTASAYVYAAPGRRLRFTVWDYVSSNHVAGSPVIFTGSGGWQRVTLSFTAANSGNHGVIVQNDNDTTTDPFWVDGVQVEQKPFATSFVDGTRGGGLLRYSHPGIAGELTLALWFRPTRPSPTPWTNYIDWKDTASGYRLYLEPNTSYQLLAGMAGVYSGGVGLVIDETACASWHFFVASRDNAGKISMYMDGIYKWTYDYSAVTWNPDYLYVGCGNAGTENANGLFSNLLMLRSAVDADTVAEWYALQKPFFDPAPVLSVPAPSGVSLSVA